jgi:hypothetical protein
VDKDPTQYARKIKQMIIIKSQRQENQGAADFYGEGQVISMKAKNLERI